MIILAHSLGNMVVCSAIQDHGFRPDRFFMLNAAVPAEAFDATQWNTATNLNPMLHEEWHDYPDQDGSGRITVEGGTGGAMRYHSWQKQERFKGRFGVDAWLGNAGTSWMGWGLSNEGYWE